MVKVTWNEPRKLWEARKGGNFAAEITASIIYRLARNEIRGFISE